MYPKNQSDLGHMPFLTIYHKTFAEKLKAIHPKSCQEGEKEIERQLQSVMS